ncbi:hypothetical protein CRUP_012548 [Coryphaenoides rupestris]|nr:hypothetical protein CRUP_012548 [Coryphaenoides rupestris]
MMMEEEEEEVVVTAGTYKRDGPRSILHYLYKSTLGESVRSQMRQCLQEPFVRSLASYSIHHTASPFNRRITALEWHPAHPSTLVAASKGGDLMLWDFDAFSKTQFVKGKGAGDFIGGMKFCPTDLSKIYTASGDGTLSLRSFDGCTATVLSTTQQCSHDHHDVCYWYCCVDVSVSRRMLVTADNVGKLSLLSLDGQKATWHPVYDLIVAGRYPDDKVLPGDRRTVDVYDANTGALVHQLSDPNASGIIPVNKFNSRGDVIASGMGVNILVWKQDDSPLSERCSRRTEGETPSRAPAPPRATSSRSQQGGSRQLRSSRKKLTSLKEPKT